MASETELCRIAFKYGTDKCKKIKHPFTPYYYKILSKKRKSVKKVIEIGIGLKRHHSNSPKNTIGAGLYMWRDYFPNAKVFGADIDPNTMFADDRIQTFVCDQSSKKDLVKLIKNTGSDIDLVIDDGSHIPEHQIFTCLTLMPLLDKKVIYIIEDVRDENIARKLTAYDYEVILPKEHKYPDDRLVVIKQKWLK